MDKMKVLDRIKEILDESRVGVMSTVDDNQPNARYMIFYNDDFTLYTKTSDETPKFKEIEENPRTHIMLGYHEDNNRAYLEITGTVHVVEDQKTIDRLFKSQDKSYFDSSQDPDLAVLKIVPDRIKIMNDDDYSTTELKL